MQIEEDTAAIASISRVCSHGGRASKKPVKDILNVRLAQGQAFGTVKYKTVCTVLIEEPFDICLKHDRYDCGQHCTCSSRYLGEAHVQHRQA